MEKTTRLLPARSRMFPAVLLTVSSFLLMLSVGCERDTPEDVEVKLDKTSLSLSKGETYTLQATVTPEGDYTVVWESDNPDVVSVNEGVVEAIAEGSATITVTVPDAGCSAECEVEVRDDVSVTITLDKTSLSLEAGDTYTLKATVVPEGDYTVVWESDNTGVASVDGGVVTAIAEGSAKITASVPEAGCSAECMVEVTMSPDATINIPDQAFLDFLLLEPEVNIDMDDRITYAEASGFEGEMILPYNAGIKSVEGIGYFTGMVKFHANLKNEIEEIDLSKCCGLREIYIFEKSVKTIVLPEDCSRLEVLDVHSTKITELDLTPCSNLKSLDISWCFEMKTIDLTPVCGFLERLRAINVPDMDFAGLDKSFTSLKYMNIQFTPQITTAPDAPILEYMDVIGTGIKSIDCSSYPNITDLQAADIDLVGFDTNWDNMVCCIMSDWHTESADFRNKKNIDIITVLEAGSLNTVYLADRCPNLTLPDEVKVVYGE